MLTLGGGMLEQLLAVDPGYRGPRVPCGQGHEAEFVSYRAKVIDTALGPVRLTRAWYHCAACKHGFAPRDAERGVAGASLSPGLAAMTDRAAAAGPFAEAAGLLEVLGGVRLTVKRVERAAETSGAEQAAAVRDRAALIAGRKVVPLPPSPLPDKLYACIDGTGVPMTAKETAGRDGKAEDGRARTREVKLAVFFTQDRLDASGYPVRDQLVFLDALERVGAGGGADAVDVPVVEVFGPGGEPGVLLVAERVCVKNVGAQRFPLVERWLGLRPAQPDEELAGRDTFNPERGCRRRGTRGRSSPDTRKPTTAARPVWCGQRNQADAGALPTPEDDLGYLQI